MADTPDKLGGVPAGKLLNFLLGSSKLRGGDESNANAAIYERGHYPIDARGHGIALPVLRPKIVRLIEDENNVRAGECFFDPAAYFGGFQLQ